MPVLKDFERHINSQLLKRGRKYYENGSIINLEEVEESLWTAEVEGSEIYEVEVEINNRKKVSGYSCSCPHCDGLCKHVIAVLFLIREEIESHVNVKNAKTKKSGFEELLQKISLDEYKDFIRQYAKGRNGFKTEFELWFASKDNSDDTAKNYQELLKKLIRNHERSGFIDFRATYSLYSKVDKLFQTGSVQVAEKKYMEAFALAQAVLTSMIEVLAYADDSDANISSTVDGAIVLIEAIINDEETPIELKEKVYHFIVKELKRSIYFDYGDFGYDLFTLLGPLAVTIKQTGPFQQLLDEMIALHSTSEGSYTRNFFRLQKIDFLNETGQREESEKLVQQNLDIVEVRKEEVKKALLQSDFKKAKNLIVEGIKLAKKKGHPGTVDQWKMELLRIAELEDDIKTIRIYTKYFAFDSGFNRKFYNQWKKTFTGQEWSKVIEELIEEKTRALVKEEGKNKGNPGLTQRSLLHSLAPIHIEEGNWDRLWELVSKSGDFDTAWYYHEYLYKKYPGELLELYVKGLEEKGDYASQRSDYAELVRKMKKISKDFQHGREKMAQVAQLLIVRHPRRSAMSSEFKKLLITARK